jgi:hypothetical protein
MPPVAEGRHCRGLVPPADRAVRKGVQQNSTKVSAGYLRSTAVSLVGLIQQNVAVLVEDALCFGLSLDEPKKFLKEPGCLEGELPVVFVDIE